jgi:PadR family transcriptional regulator, regulatory protein PadR
MELKGQIDLLLLSALAEGPSHGYGVIERLRERSQGVLDYAESTVYSALRRLERAGLLASRLSTGRRRRVYRLTRSGRRRLERERKEWALLARAVARVVG